MRNDGISPPEEGRLTCLRLPYGNVVLTDAAVATLRGVEDSVVVSTTGRVVAVVGLRDVVVVDTEDALLVCPRDRAHEVKQVVDGLKANGHAAHV